MQRMPFRQRIDILGEGRALPNKTCVLYSCAVNDKGYTDCGECDELPCKRFFELKDPNTSQEEHLASIQMRAARLKGIQ
jgi:hypothetical protein